MIAGIVQTVLLFTGGLFILISAIGILRMPDLYMRLQVTSKASVLGLTLVLMAVAIHFQDPSVTIRAGVIICFLVLTIPVATHMLARAGYATNTPISDETVINELAGHYDPGTHLLSGDDPLEWELEVQPGAAAAGRAVADLGLPTDVLITEILRQGEVVVPRGQTVVQPRDKLRILARPDRLPVLRELLQTPEVSGRI